MVDVATGGPVVCKPARSAAAVQQGGCCDSRMLRPVVLQTGAPGGDGAARRMLRPAVAVLQGSATSSSPAARRMLRPVAVVLQGYATGNGGVARRCARRQ
jgi:hypothetical protein